MTIAIRAIRLRSSLFGKVRKSLSIKIVKSCKRYRTDINQRIKPAVLYNKSNTDLYNPNKRGHLYVAYSVYSPYVVKIGVSGVGRSENPRIHKNQKTQKNGRSENPRIHKNQKRQVTRYLEEKVSIHFVKSGGKRTSSGGTIVLLFFTGS